MCLRDLHAAAVFAAEQEGAFQQFLVRRGCEHGRLILLFGDDTVRMVDTDLRPRVDAVLSFPELDQPCPAVVVKIYRQGVKNHLETRRHVVVEPGIARLPLPRIQGAGEETVLVMITIPERSDDLVYLAAFLARIHTPDPADDPPLSPPEEDTAEKCHE